MPAVPSMLKPPARHRKPRPSRRNLAVARRCRTPDLQPLKGLSGGPFLLASRLYSQPTTNRETDMASKIDIFNMALSHIGQSKTVADLNENSPARRACSRFYDTDLDILLSEFDWRFATRSVVLANIGSPPTNWAYRYRYPNDCLKAIRLVVPGIRDPQEAEEIPFEVIWESSGRSIITDQADAELLYITRVAGAERYPSNFVSALSYKLAASISMPLANDKSLMSDMLQMYERTKQDAMAQS